jgi:hypothetical protein
MSTSSVKEPAPWVVRACLTTRLVVVAMSRLGAALGRAHKSSQISLRLELMGGESERWLKPDTGARIMVRAPSPKCRWMALANRRHHARAHRVISLRFRGRRVQQTTDPSASRSTVACRWTLGTTPSGRGRRSPRASARAAPGADPTHPSGDRCSSGSEARPEQPLHALKDADSPEE